MGSNDKIFVSGPGGESPLQNVVGVWVDPSVTSIPSHAFKERKKLTEVGLCEGLVEIGADFFKWCEHSITKINIPTLLRRICNYAFYKSLRCPIRLHDGIEGIGEYLLAASSPTTLEFRSSSPRSLGILAGCKSTLSVEMPKNIMEIRNFALMSCYCLRNVAFPPTRSSAIESLVD